jgi:subtilisin family serine protease
MSIRGLRTATVAAVIAAAALSRPLVIGAEKPEQLIIKCEKPCAGAIGAVAAVGGETTFVYENVGAIAVTVPSSRVHDLTMAVGADAVRKDVTVSLPPREAVEADSPISSGEVSGDAIAGFVGAQPANYNYNNSLTNAAPLHAAGMVGADVVVGVIDSGTVFSGLIAPSLAALAGTVIGGENFVPAVQDPVTSATSRLNDWHGTAVGTMIAAHANFAFISTSRLANTVRLNAPASIVDCPNAAFPGCPLNASVIPMFGTAPAAKIYALKVFSSRGGGSPESRIIAAMDRAITLRRNFNNGGSTIPVSGTGTENDPFKYDALNIKVVNMSLGGPTLFAGRDLEDQLTLKMLDVGITIVTSAGNDGFGALTGGSPGTGMGSLTIGASSTPVHERVVLDLQFPTRPLGFGKLYRPFDGVQTAYFSSRGPTADGRFDPELSANGFASYVNAFAAVVGGAITSCGAIGVPTTGPNACASRILFVSGTSFSSPTVAGAAALLRGAAPSATATQTRNALVRGANPAIVSDGSGRIDQGAGFLDVSAALALLKSGKVSDDLSTGKHDDDEDDDADDVGQGGKSVAGNLQRLGIRPVQFSHDRFTAQVNRLKPGQVSQFYVPSDIFTNKLVVSITNIVKEGPQNTLFGDDFFVMGIDAPTSFAVHRIGDGGDFVGVDTTFTIDNPQTGLVRIALQGDWTNGGPVSAKVTIDRQRSLATLPSAIGRIRQDDLVPYTIDIPAGVTEGVIELFWLQNWGRYPTNDLDMLVIDPAGHVAVDAAGNPLGASLDSPERAVLADPAPGTWTVLVSGFTIWPQGHSGHHPGKDTYTLTATADGHRLKVAK